MANWIERFFTRLLNDAFPGVEPMTFTYGRALGPLRTELLGLKRNHARDEIRLTAMYEAWHTTRLYYFAGRERRAPYPIDALDRRQRRRERRIAEIEAKLRRDGRMKGPRQAPTGTS